LCGGQGGSVVDKGTCLFFWGVTVWLFGFYCGWGEVFFVLHHFMWCLGSFCLWFCCANDDALQCVCFGLFLFCVGVACCSSQKRRGKGGRTRRNGEVGGENADGKPTGGVVGVGGGLGGGWRGPSAVAVFILISRRTKSTLAPLPTQPLPPLHHLGGWSGGVPGFGGKKKVKGRGQEKGGAQKGERHGRDGGGAGGPGRGTQRGRARRRGGDRAHGREGAVRFRSRRVPANRVWPVAVTCVYLCSVPFKGLRRAEDWPGDWLAARPHRGGLRTGFLERHARQVSLVSPVQSGHRSGDARIPRPAAASSFHRCTGTYLLSRTREGAYTLPRPYVHRESTCSKPAPR